MKNSFKDLVLGFIIGGTMSVPGVSGGTTAIALGCYEKILTAAAELRQKKNVHYLLKILLGGILGFFLVAGFLNESFRILPVTMTMLFCAAAGTGIFLLGKEAFEKGISINGILFFLLGAGAVIAVERLPKGNGYTSPLLMILWGFFLAAGIILPGISTSHLLLVFGLYDDITQFSEWKQVLSMIPLAAGVGIGMLFLTKPLAKGLEKYPIHCRFALLGFAVGSLKALIEPCIGDPQTGYLLWFQIVNGIVLSVGAICGILKLNRGKNKMKKL